MQYENYLSHYGTKGMHWGVRKYQNEDGSYTEAGRERYGIGQKSDKTSRNYAVKGETESGRTHTNSTGKAVKVAKERPVKGVSRGIGDAAEQQAARKRNMNKFLKVAGAVALTAALAYGASTAIRDSQAGKIKLRDLDGWEKANWEPEDIRAYKNAAENEQDIRRASLTRRQAIANLFRGKDGYDENGEPNVKWNPSIGAAQSLREAKKQAGSYGWHAEQNRKRSSDYAEQIRDKENLMRRIKQIAGETKDTDEKKSLTAYMKALQEEITDLDWKKHRSGISEEEYRLRRDQLRNYVPRFHNA